MLKKVVIYVTALMLSQFSIGQNGSIMTNLKSNLKRADELYANYSFGPAAELYTFILKKSPNNDQIKLKVAECYRKLNDNVNAAKWYAKVVEKDSVVSPVHLLYYAQALNASEQYEEAKLWYSRYQERIKTDNRALNRVWGINNLADFYRDSASYSIQKLSINTKAADFSPTYYQDGLVFVSSVGKELFIQHVYSWDQSALLDVYFSRIKPNGDLTKSQKFNGAVNSRYHEGPAVFFDGDRKMIFTRSSLRQDGKVSNSQDGVGHIGLYYAERASDGKSWTGITSLPFNDDNFSVGHPAITSDGATLYFISDMPGGRGGMDIYYSKLEGGTWSKPVNMGPQINTEGNEMFPFIQADSVLYFSSDGYGGLGGLDIYKADLKGEDALIVSNPGYPINTSADDFAFITDKNGQSGYFSSNRKGGKGSDDIYHFSVKSLILEGTVAEAANAQVLDGSKLTLLSTRTRKEMTTTAEKGTFSFPVHPGENYVLKTTKEAFADKTIIVPTQKYHPGDTIRVKVSMEKETIKGTDLVAYIYDAKTGNALPQAQIYLLDEVTSEEKMLTGGIGGTFSFKAAFSSSYAIIAEQGNKSGILSGIVANNPAILKNDTIRIPCYDFPQPSGKKQLAKIALEGLVLDGNNRALIAGANVHLYEMTSQKETKISREDGRIAFELEPGNYILKVDKEAYSSRSIVFSTTQLEKADKPQLSIRLDKGRASSAPLIAYVYDGDTRKSVSGAEIYLLNEVTSDERSLKTDKRGYFRFDAKHDCSYAVVVEKGEKSNVLTSLVVNKDTLQIPITGPSSSMLVTKEIHPATILSIIPENEPSGTVTSTVVIQSSISDELSRTPLNDVLVALFDNATGNEIEGHLNNGQTLFEVKAGSNYILKSSKPGYRNKVSIVTTKEWTMGDTISVNLAMEKIVPGNSMVRTQLVDEKSGQPLAATRIYLLNETTGAEKHITTDKQGYLSFEADSKSDYAMATEGRETAGIVKHWNNVYPTGKNNSAAVTSASKAPDAKIIAPIKLIVTDRHSSKPVSSVDGQLIDSRTQKSTKGLVTHNNLSFSGIANTTYIAKVAAKGYKNKTKLISTIDNPASDTLVVRLALDRILPATVPIEVEVIDEASGSPLANAQLYLLNQKTSDEKKLKTDQSGLAQFSADPTAIYSIIADKNDKSGVLNNIHPADVTGKSPVRIIVNKSGTSRKTQQAQPLSLRKPAFADRKISEASGAEISDVAKAREYKQRSASGIAYTNSANGAEIFAIQNISGHEQVFVNYKGRMFEFKEDQNLKYLQTINGKMRLVIDQTDDEEEQDLAALLERKLTESAVPVKSFTRINSIYYDIDQSSIREDARPELDKLITLLKAVPHLKIELRAYADSRESPSYNISLSALRAREANSYLIGKGISQTRIRVNYFGEKALVNNCGDGVPCPDDQHQQNRRTEFLIRY